MPTKGSVEPTPLGCSMNGLVPIGGNYFYEFYVEGLDKYYWIVDNSEKEARQQLWNKLDSYEQNSVVQIECIDVKP